MGRFDQMFMFADMVSGWFWQDAYVIKKLLKKAKNMLIRNI